MRRTSSAGSAICREGWAGYDATAKLHRSDFGVSKFAPMIVDEADIIISAPFEKIR